MRSLVFIAASSVAFATPVIAQAPAPAASAAAQADFAVGAAVRASDGAVVAKVVSADAEKVVLDTGDTKVAVPPSFFKKDANGIIMTITADQFAQARAKAHARTEAEKAAEQVPQASQTPDAQKPATPPK